MITYNLLGFVPESSSCLLELGNKILVLQNKECQLRLELKRVPSIDI